MTRWRYTTDPADVTGLPAPDPATIQATGPDPIARHRRHQLALAVAVAVVVLLALRAVRRQGVAR